MDLYHADIKLPEGFRLPARSVRLSWTGHAMDARSNDRYGAIPLATEIDLRAFRVIEVGITGRKVEKVVIRGHLDEDRDVIYVLIPGMTWTVKTVWCNLKTDSHSTLDRSRYVC